MDIEQEAELLIPVIKKSLQQEGIYDNYIKLCQQYNISYPLLEIEFARKYTNIIVRMNTYIEYLELQQDLLKNQLDSIPVIVFFLHDTITPQGSIVLEVEWSEKYKTMYINPIFTLQTSSQIYD